MNRMQPEDWDRRYLDHPSPWTDTANRLLVDTVERLEPGTALDLACGEGRNSLWLAHRGWTVTGVDFSPVATARATRAAGQEGLDAEFITADLTKWKTEARYDLVCILYLHLPHDVLAPIFERATHAVGPGGTLFAIGHHIDNLTEGHGGPQSADVLYTETQLAGWCPVAPVRTERVIRTVDGPDGPLQAIDALFVGRG